MEKRVQKEERKAKRASGGLSSEGAPPPPPALGPAAAAALALASSWPGLYPVLPLPSEPPSAADDDDADLALQDGSSLSAGGAGDAALAARLASREAFVLSKKRPQVRWFVARAREVLAQLPPAPAPPLIVDVCGGRGGLGLALAAALPCARVLVLDASPPAVAAGARAAAAAGLSNLAFLAAALPLAGGAAALREAAGGAAPALLLGLHACGGLTDLIVDLARSLSAAFCVAPCCFTKHGGVAGGEGAWGADCARAVERLAESEFAALRRPAMAALNSVRLRRHEGWAACQLLAFPEELSAKNQVLLGLPRRAAGAPAPAAVEPAALSLTWSGAAAGSAPLCSPETALEEVEGATGRYAFPSAPPPPPPPLGGALPALRACAGKLRGRGAPPPPRAGCLDAAASGALTLIGMGALAGLHFSAGARAAGLELLVGSFAATAVLVFAAPDAPLAQPRNVLAGHALSAAVGVAVRAAVADSARAGALPAAAALSVALSVWAMAAGGVTHPPGGATALIAVVGGEGVRALGWWYVLNVLAGAAVLVAVALLNNMLPGRVYPRYW